MDKPKWKDAPEWANWLAKDEDGSWRWFEYQPKYENMVWIKSKIGGRCMIAGGQLHKPLLEQRPHG